MSGRNDWAVLGLLVARERLWGALAPVDPTEPDQHATVYQAIASAIDEIDLQLQSLGHLPGPVCERDHDVIAMELESSDPDPVGNLYRCPTCGRPEQWSK